MWVYRDGRRRELAPALVADAAGFAALAAGSSGEARRRAAVDALIVAGEIEAALADVDHPRARQAAHATDDLADLAVGAGPARPYTLDAADLPRALVVTRAEGFAYYALHPDAFARAALEAATERDVLVVGVRSIGTTLGAACAAALRKHGVRAQRISVRPIGHPFDRELALTALERAQIASAGEVLVVDEGPGASGSTLLAVAEACARAPARRVTVICSHAPNPEALRARDGADRWRALRVRVAGEGPSPEHASDLSAGEWRRRAFASEHEWPAVWCATERRKLLTPDGRQLLKFEGLARAGREALARAEALGDAGFGLVPERAGDGWAAWPLAEGTPMTPEDFDPDVALHLARYVAARPQLCAPRDVEDLTRFVVDDTEALFGRVPPPWFTLRVERPATVDARTLPHEWLRLTDGRIVKTDALAHGDDHFFPGPCDIAWDLAGIAVEWRLSGAALDALLDGYATLSGDDARPRFPSWLLAYSILRASFASMAIESSAEVEALRHARDLARYRAVAAGLLGRTSRDADCSNAR